MGTGPILILVEVEPDGESLTGRAVRMEPREPHTVRLRDPRAREFSGWIGLLSALETLVLHPQPPDTSPPGRLCHRDQDARS